MSEEHPAPDHADRPDAGTDLPSWLSGDISLAVPMLPDVAVRVISMTSETDISVIKLSELVAKDQVLASRVLGLANSAASASAMEISTVRDAIVRLGTTVVRNLVVTVSMASNTQDRRVYGTRAGQLFAHALGTAYVARLVAEQAGVDPDESFLCGLMHDIGKLVILKVAYDVNRQAPGKLPSDEVARALAEHHARIGGVALRRWRLPESVDEPIIYHHAYLEAPTAPREAAVCYLANRLSHRYGFGCEEEPVDLLADPVFAYLGLDEEWLIMMDAKAPGLVSVAGQLLR
jgi:putative nucleotidyltransferase with HDIG domain